MTTDYIEPQPRFLGFCTGIPGAPCGKRIMDDDLDAIELENGAGVMCSRCEDKLFGGKSWGSHLDTPKKAAQSRGGKMSAQNGLGIDFPGSTPMHPKLGGRPPGTELSQRTKKARRRV